MVNVEVEFTDKQYSLFDKLKMFGDTAPDILKNIFFRSLSQVPDLNKELESVKLSENIERIKQELDGVYALYDETTQPLDAWNEEKFGHITGKLNELHIFKGVVGSVSLANEYKLLWERTFNTLTHEYDDVDEYDAVAIATLFTLSDFSEGALEGELLHDCAIYLMEMWFIKYAHTLKLSKETGNRRHSKPLSYDPIVPDPIL